MNVDSILDAIIDIRKDKNFNINNIEKIKQYIIPVFETPAPASLYETFFKIISKEINKPEDEILYNVLLNIKNNKIKVFYSEKFLNYLIDEKFPSSYLNLVAKTGKNFPISFLKNLKKEKITLEEDAYLSIFLDVLENNYEKLPEYFDYIYAPIEKIISFVEPHSRVLDSIADKILYRLLKKVRQTNNYNIYKSLPLWFIQDHAKQFIEITMKTEEDIFNVMWLLFEHFNINTHFLDDNYDLIHSKLFFFLYLIYEKFGENTMLDLINSMPVWFIKKHEEDFSKFLKIYKKF